MRVLKILVSIVLTISCTSPNEINNWVGKYEYNEKPVKALAGYNMVMLWTIEIKQEKENYVALIEVNGQQTYMLIQATVNGDKNKVKLIFDKGIEGVGYENFKKGDSLIELHVENEKIITKWNKLTPMLVENFKNDTVFFESNDSVISTPQ